MTFAPLAGFLLAWSLGSLIVAALWPQARRRRDELGLMLSLGVIVGLGATSVIFFAVSLVAPKPAWPAAAIETAVAIALAVTLARRAASRPADTPPSTATPLSWLHWALATVLAQATVVGSVVVWRAFRTEPFGGWDGWAIWNLQARAMVRGGNGWPELLATPELSWTHPDYPKLVSASVARLWSWTGSEPAGAAGLVSVAFATASLGVLVFALARLRSRTPALLTGLLLVGTPFFLSFAPNQHADLPLASFLLAAVALGALGERWALAGLCAGFAAWTKNEGLLFAGVFALGAGWHAWRSSARHALPKLLAGLAFALAPVLWLKLALAPSNDLLATPLGPRLAQLLAPDRHRLILEVLWRDLRGFGEWRMLPFLAMALPFAAWRGRARLAGGARLLPLALGGMLAGYYLVYLLSPQNLAWHLDTSLVRLLLQLWPLALLGWGLTFPCRELDPLAPPTAQLPTRLAFLGVNTLAGLALIAVLSGQLAANEFAVKRDHVGTIRVTLGDGWHGRNTTAATPGRGVPAAPRSTSKPPPPPRRSRCASRCAVSARAPSWCASPIACSGSAPARMRSCPWKSPASRFQPAAPPSRSPPTLRASPNPRPPAPAPSPSPSTISPSPDRPSTLINIIRIQCIEPIVAGAHPPGSSPSGPSPPNLFSYVIPAVRPDYLRLKPTTEPEALDRERAEPLSVLGR